MGRRNDEIAALFGEMAELMEIRGDDRFRILSYRRGADALAGLAADVETLSDRERQAVRGIGKALAGKIAEYLETGKIATLEKLREEIPDGVRMLTRVRGLGPKRARVVYDQLGVSSVEELKAAAEQGRLRGVKGLGEKAEENLLRAIEGYTPGGERRVLLARALPLAESLVGELSTYDGVLRCAFAGSVRRMKETIGDLDVLVATHDPDAVAKAFASLSHVVRVEASGDTKTSVLTTEGLQVDMRTVEPDVFGAALQYFTGSKEHNVKVREHAVRTGYKLSEYGLFDAETGDRLAAATEEEVYGRLGMQWVPPTMREDRGEVEAALAGELPEVVQLEQIRGDLQSHSTYSDGKRSVRDMALAAADRGYEYFAVTDHGLKIFFGGLTLDAIEAQRKEVDAVNDELAGRFTLLHGVELNIDRDGGLDYPDDVLATFDVCVASVHGQFDLSAAEQTQRLIRAISNPQVHILGHPAGRRLDRRPGMDFDVQAVARAAIEHKVALEVNAHPWRLDLRDEHVRWAMDEGALLAISTDAHSPPELDNMRFGVGTAQRGWATPDRVITTWPLDRLRRFLAKE